MFRTIKTPAASANKPAPAFIRNVWGRAMQIAPNASVTCRTVEQIAGSRRPAHLLMFLRVSSQRRRHHRRLDSAMVNQAEGELIALATDASIAVSEKGLAKK